MTIRRFGGVDLLFANAGGPPAGPALSFDDTAGMMQANLLLFSTANGAGRRALDEGARRWRDLVSTSSSVKEPIPNLELSTVPCVCLGARQDTGAELAASGIRVNQIVPGRLDTARVRELDEINGKKQGISAAEAKAKSIGSIPLGRYGDPTEFGRVGAFLLSNAASYLTGATVQVDGGLIRSVL